MVSVVLEDLKNYINGYLLSREIVDMGHGKLVMKICSSSLLAMMLD